VFFFASLEKYLPIFIRKLLHRRENSTGGGREGLQPVPGRQGR
jgi:hypothetical protein